MVSMPPAHQAHIDNARIQLDEEKNFLEHLEFIVKVTVDVITSGDISTAILTEAGCENISSIIIGSRGKGLVKGLPLGSVSADILRNGKTHILILRHSLAGELEGGSIQQVLSRDIYLDTIPHRFF